MKRNVYVETSVISYLTARPSKTIPGAAHQRITLAGLSADMELSAYRKPGDTNTHCGAI
jgi:hypothetical protein